MSELTPTAPTKKLSKLQLDFKTTFETENEAFKARMAQLRGFQAEGYSNNDLVDWLVKQTQVDYENMDRSRSIMNVVAGLGFLIGLFLIGWIASMLILAIAGALK